MRIAADREINTHQENSTQNAPLLNLFNLLKIAKTGELCQYRGEPVTMRDFYDSAHLAIEEHNQRRIKIESIAEMPSLTSEEKPLNDRLSKDDLCEINNMTLDKYWQIEQGNLKLSSGTTIDPQITRHLKEKFLEVHSEEMDQFETIFLFLIKTFNNQDAQNLWTSIDRSCLNILFSLTSIPADRLTKNIHGVTEMLTGAAKVAVLLANTDTFTAKLEETSLQKDNEDLQTGFKKTEDLYTMLQSSIMYRISLSCSDIFAKWIDNEDSSYLEKTLHSAQTDLRSWGKEKFINTMSMQEGSLAHDIKNLLTEGDMTQILQTLSSANQEKKWSTINMHWKKIKSLLQLVNHTASSALTGLTLEQIKLTDAMEEIKGWLNRISTDLALSPINPDIDYKKLAILLLSDEYICQTAQNLLKEIHKNVTTIWKYEEIEKALKHKNPTTKLIMLVCKLLNRTLLAHINRPTHLQSLNDIKERSEILEPHMQCKGLLYHEEAIKPALSSETLAGYIWLSWTELQCIAYCLTAAAEVPEAILKNEELLSNSISVKVKGKKIIIHIDHLASIILAVLDQLLERFQHNTQDSPETLEVTAGIVSKNAISSVEKLNIIPWLKTDKQKETAQTHMKNIIAILLKNPQVLRFWIKVAQAFVAGALLISVINQHKERKNLFSISKKAVKQSTLTVRYGIRNAVPILKAKTIVGAELSLYIAKTAGIKITALTISTVLFTAFVLFSFPKLPLYLSLILGTSILMIKKGPKSLRPKKNERPVPSDNLNTKMKNSSLNLNPTWPLDVSNEAKCEFKIL